VGANGHAPSTAAAERERAEREPVTAGADERAAS